MWDRTFNQVMNIWVGPEIERGRERGTLNGRFELYGAQVVFFPPPSQKTEVRLNDEMKVIAEVELKKARKIKKGEAIYFEDVESIGKFQLPPDEIDAGHITIIRFQNNWFLGFDFRYNKSKARHHLETARQFTETAKFALEREYWNAFLVNAFSAAELLVKGTLMLMPFPELKRHRSIQTRYCRYVDVGNAPPEFKTTFNKLNGLRDSARYLKSPLKINPDHAKDYVNVLHQMEEDLISRLRM